MAGEYRVEVAGLRQLRATLTAADPALVTQVAQANNRAAEVVAAEARRRAPAGPHQGGGTVTPIRASVKALRAARAAAVAMGGARSPHAAPTEFGGTLRRFNSTSRTRVTHRAFLYPAIEATRPEVIRVYTLALNRIVDNVKGL